MGNNRRNAGRRVASFGGAAFTPSTLANLTSWFRGDLGVTQAGGVVSNWADQSAAGLNPNMTAAGAARPTFTASAINSLPGMTFNGTAQFFKGSASLLSGATAISMWGCFKVTTSPADQFLFGMQFNAFEYSLFINTATGFLKCFINGGANTCISVAGYNDNVAHSFIVSVDNVSGFKMYVDNGVTPVATAVSSGTIVSGTDINSIGSASDGVSNDRYLNGIVTELGSNSVALGASNCLSLMTYLKTRYGT